MTKKNSNQKLTNPHTNHRKRMRYRYIKSGLDVLAEHEVVEMLLYYAIPRKDTNEIAHKIMGEYGSLHNLFEAPPADIAARCGLTENTAVLLSLIAPLSRRYNVSKWAGLRSFSSTKALGDYAKSLLIGEVLECFYVVCLDINFKFLSVELLAKGTVDRIELYPKEIVRSVIYRNASYVVLIHNHPSGSTDVSQADLNATNHIRKLMRGMEIEVVDHIIVCGEKYVSFAEKKILGLPGIKAAK